MVVEAIAAGTVALLRPYFEEGAKSFAKKAGEQLAEKVRSLFGAIKARFAGDHDAEQSLALVEAKPQSKQRMLVLEEVLAEKMARDPDFAETLSRLVEEATKADTQNFIVFGDRSIAIDGDVTGSTIITGNNNVVGKS
jgi:hypothetical protein